MNSKNINQSVKFKPKIIHLDLTGKCNLSCLHCRGSYSLNELSYEEWIKIIDQISKYWKDEITWVEVGGGEPFLRKDLFKIIKYIKGKLPNAKILLVTNGTLIGKEHFKLISNLVDRIQFSLDGAKKSTHDLIRQSDGCFEKVITTIKKLKEDQKKYILIRSTINKLNYDELEEIIQLGKSLGVNEIGIRSMVISRGSAVVNKDLGISSKDYIQLVHNIPILQLKYKIRIYSGDPIQNLVDPLFVKNIKSRGYDFNRIYAGCIVGIAYIYINNEGIFSFCPMLNDLKIGDLLKEDVFRVWNESEILINLRKKNYSNESNCFECKFKNLCGGCRARSFFKEGNLFSQDPFCDNFLIKEINSIWENKI